MKINFTPKKFYVKFLKSNLMTKISVYYITILCISIALASMAFNSINSAVIVKKTSASAQQTLEALDQNLSYLVSNVSQFSSYVFFDNNVQSALKKSHRKGIDPSIQDDISKSLVNMILSSDDISSAFLFDNYNNSYYMSRITGSKVLSDDVKKASWYNTVEEAKGYPVWVLNDGQLIQSGSDDMPVSLVRMVYSTDDYRPIGVLVMNINKSFGNHIFSRLGSQYKSQFFIVDSNGNYITQNTTAENTIVSDFIKKSTGSTNYAIEKIDGQKVILTSRKSSCSDWRIIGIMPMSELSKQFESTGMVILLIILINVLFLCIGQIYVTKIITKPLSKMKKYMKIVINDIDEPAVDRVVTELHAMGAKVVGQKADISILENVEALLKLTLDTFGQVDMLVNNAGVSVSGPIWEIPIQDVRWITEVNMMSHLYGMHADAQSPAAVVSPLT